MKKIVEFAKKYKRKIAQTVVALVVSIICMGVCEVALADSFNMYNVADWDLANIVNNSIEWDMELPTDIENYAEYVVVYSVETEHQTRTQKEGYYLVANDTRLYLGTAHVYGWNYLYVSGSMSSNGATYYKAALEDEWELIHPYTVNVGVARVVVDGEDIHYDASILEVSGSGIKSKIGDVYDVCIESFAYGSDVEYDKGYYSDIDFTNLSVDGLLKSLNGLVDFIGAFPLVIGAVFAFMPSWLQALITVGIGVGVILFIWKIIT